MNVKSLLELLRRTKKSGYKQLIMNNRMIMASYTVKEDGDVGLHYILHIPENEEYSDPFYDCSVLIDPNEIINVYKVGHNKLLEEKKKRKSKPKDVHESVYFNVYKNGTAALKFEYVIEEDIISTEEYVFNEYPLKESNPMMENVLNAYSAMLMDRIRIGGCAVVLDGYKTGMAQYAEESVQIYYYTIKMNGKKIQIPLYKSLLMAQKKFDEFFVSIQETNMDRIYIITYQFARKGLIEQFIGYIMSF